MTSNIFGDSKEKCFICCKYGQTEEHHIFEGSNRQASEKWGLKVHLCREHHEKVHSGKGQGMREYLHQTAQERYEEMQMERGYSREKARELFIKDFIRSYIVEDK